MRFIPHRQGTSRPVKGVGLGAAKTLSVASQIAMLCPSGMDVWMQRELASGHDRCRREEAPRR